MRISDWSSDVCSSDLEHRVATGDGLGVVALLRSAPARGVRAGGAHGGLALPARRGVAILGRLPLAGDVPAAVFRLGRGPLALEGLASEAAGAFDGTLLAGFAFAGAPWLTHRSEER